MFCALLPSYHAAPPTPTESREERRGEKRGEERRGERREREEKREREEGEETNREEEVRWGDEEVSWRFSLFSYTS